MTEDEELFALEELPNLRHFLVRDVGNGAALISFRFAFQQDAGDELYARQIHLSIFSDDFDQADDVVVEFFQIFGGNLPFGLTVTADLLNRIPIDKTFLHAELGTVERKRITTSPNINRF